jgi:hypothetical protein
MEGAWEKAALRRLIKREGRWPKPTPKNPSSEVISPLRAAILFSTGYLLAAPAFAVKRVHNRSVGGHTGPVQTSMAVDCKSLQAADRMLARTAGAVTREGHLPTKTKGGNSLTAVTDIPAKAVIIETRMKTISRLRPCRPFKRFRAHRGLS